MSTQHFYDRYHQQNQSYQGIIKPGNFTYWLTMEWLKKVQPSGDWRGLDVLDIGCGVGSVSLYLASLGAKVDGIDISQRAIGIAKQAAIAYPELKVNFTKQSFPNAQIRKKYDVVLCFEVIEHIQNQDKFLSAIGKLLKPRGLLVLSTPHQKNLLTTWGFHQDFDRRVGHVRRYSIEELKKVLRTNNLGLKAWRLNEGVLRNILFTQSKWGWAVRFIRGPVVPIFQWLDELSGKLFGFTDIQIVAHKKVK